MKFEAIHEKLFNVRCQLFVGVNHHKRPGSIINKRRGHLYAMLMSFYLFSKMTEQSSTTRTVERATSYGRRRRVGCRRRGSTTLASAESCVQGAFNRPGRAGLLCHLRNINYLWISQPTRPAAPAGRFRCVELAPSLKKIKI